MWIFTTHGFISIVQHKDIPDQFQIKSRAPEPLELLWPEHEIQVLDWADYMFRINVPKSEVISVLIEITESVDYTSFKHEWEDNQSYHDALVRVWTVMYNYQIRMEAVEHGEGI